MYFPLRHHMKLEICHKSTQIFGESLSATLALTETGHDDDGGGGGGRVGGGGVAVWSVVRLLVT